MMVPCKCAECSSGVPKCGRYEAWEEGAPWEHPGQAGAQLSPSTGSSSTGRALTLGTWLVALPARSNELYPLSHPCCHQLWGSLCCSGTSCPMGPMQGDVYAQSVLSLRAGPEHPLHYRYARAGSAFKLVTGLSTGPCVAGVRCEVATACPGSSSDFFVSVCYSNGSGWGPAGLRRLWALMSCGIVWSMAWFLKENEKWEAAGMLTDLSWKGGPPLALLEKEIK